MKKQKQQPGKKILNGEKKKNYLVWGVYIALPLIAIVLYFLLRNNKPVFSGENAYNLLKKQCDFGPRVPGIPAHENTRAYLTAELKKYSDLVTEQKFTYKDKKDTAKIWEGYNIVASFNKDKAYRVLLCAHWDSRPWADNDPVPENMMQPVPGANDGASGVAVLTELARLMAEQKPDIGVDIVFFDLEDIGDDDAENHPDKLNPFAIGAEKFIEMNPSYKPAWGILLDMVGDKDLILTKEANSIGRAGSVLDRIFKAAKKLDIKEFKDEPGGAVGDDHIPFLKRFIPVADLVHSPFPEYWHTVNDTPDKCSAASLEKVGRVLVEVIYSEK